MAASIFDLPWLPPPPANFSVRCRAVADGGAALGPAIQMLAGHRLSTVQTLSLTRTITHCRESNRDLAPLSSFRLAVLAGSTFDVIVRQLPAAAARHGVALDVITAPYDQVMQQALDPASGFYTPKPDGVLIAVDHRWLRLQEPVLDESWTKCVDAAVDGLRSVVAAVRANSKAAVILQTVAVPPSSLFGSFDRRIAGSVRMMIDRANAGIVELAERTNCYLLDVDALAQRVGTDRWFNPAHWASYKMAFSTECDLVYADFVGRLVGAIRGKARKCLVLDLDNTIWGGVIGDDGLDGIEVGQGSALGEAYLSVQRMALALRSRGILLAVASKNDDHVAREPFKSHREMLLREEHIAVFQANWHDKASNLQAIAEALNIGVDALVLLDDNPAERAQVRAALPMVAVPELPTDPAWYSWYLEAAGYFESVSFSSEDRSRADTYAADARRAEIRLQTGNVGDYLSSLDMSLIHARFDQTGRKRIEQLINKTNQFNLTTRRYTDGDLDAVYRDPNAFSLQVRLKDRFGDMGMIGVVICRFEDDAASGRTWNIDTWLMSCRVLGRCVEEGMLSLVVDAARRDGIERLVGTYVPTAKNGMVRDHYSKLGFELKDEQPSGRRLFELDIRNYQTPELPLILVAASSDAPAVS